MNPAPKEGVLLYYKYVDLRLQQHELHAWMQHLCTELHLRGRVRVARDGINVTVGGSHAALQSHIAAVTAHHVLGGGIDFKLAALPSDCSEAAILEAGFDKLAVTLCKEVVALGKSVCGVEDLPALAGRQASPQEFHAMLEEAALQLKPTILLDARNIYESRIGSFQVEGVETFTPKIRSFSELPKWLAEHRAELADRRVLMYCTGGVRCERASAYLRSLGPAYQEVFQLSGGIQRYLEAHPESGGHFQGRNFVFDPRCSVGPAGSGKGGHSTTMGRCQGCKVPWDDYTARRRCASCRSLILLCEGCQIKQEHVRKGILCELCAKRQQDRQPVVSDAMEQVSPQRLRILCLHGFRQSASQFRGRTAALQVKLKDIAELIFIDAPHLVRSCPRARQSGDRSMLSEGHSPTPQLPSSHRRAWLVEPEPALSPVEAVAVSAGGERVVHATDQWQRQTEGWEESGAVLRAAVARQGPFDGVLGFSQGAAVAAVLCAMQQQELEQEQQQRTERQGDEDSATERESSGHQCGCGHKSPPFRFAVFCSGYASPFLEHKRLLDSTGLLALPTLHVYGASVSPAGYGGSDSKGAVYSDEGVAEVTESPADHQVPVWGSQELLALCKSENVTTVEHGCGHIIPVRSSMVKRYRCFLERFISSEAENNALTVQR